MSKTASWTGIVSINSCILFSLYPSKIWANFTPVFKVIALERAQRWRAEPKTTVPLATLTFQMSLYSSSAYNSIKVLNSWTICFNFSWISSGVNLSSLISRSILLINKTGFTRSCSACLVTVSVCTITSSTASTTTIAPSIALRARFTFPEKSTCPGVSTRLITNSLSFIEWSKEIVALLIVIPLNCSSSR